MDINEARQHPAYGPVLLFRQATAKLRTVLEVSASEGANRQIRDALATLELTDILLVAEWHRQSGFRPHRDVL